MSLVPPIQTPSQAPQSASVQEQERYSQEQQRGTRRTQQSIDFYQRIGYPQFGGRYAPFTIPEGAKVKSIRETSSGLRVTYAGFSDVRERPHYVTVPQFSDVRERPHYVTISPPPAKEPSDWQKRGIAPSYPESRFIHSDTAPSSLGPEPKTYKSWIPQSRPESRYLIRNEPPTIADVTLAKTPPSVRAEIINKILQEQLGKPLGIQGSVSFGALSEQAWNIAVKSDVQLRELVGLQSRQAKPTLIERPLGRWSELQDFGQDIANVKANAGTSSLSRTILGLQTQIPESVKKYGVVGLGSPTAGLVMGAYEVASFERLINPYAPGLVEGLTSGKQAMIGTFVGEAALMLVGGKAVSWTVEGTYNPIKWKGSRPESWLIKHSDWYAKRAVKDMAPEIVSSPSMMIQKPISMADLKAGEKLGEYSSYFWGETPIPKATEVWLAKAPSASSGLKTWVAEAWIRRITGGTAFTLIQEEISETVKPDLPFIPEAQLFKGSSFLPSITGASVLLGLGLMPKTIGTSLAAREVAFTSLPRLTQISKPKIEALPMLKLGSIVGNVPSSVTKAFSVVSVSTKLVSAQAAVQEVKQVQSQTQVQRQIQRLTGQFKTPSLTKVTGFEFPSEEPTKKKRRKRGKGFMLEMGIGEFYYPEPPTLEQIFGKPKRRKKK